MFELRGMEEKEKKSPFNYKKIRGERRGKFSFFVKKFSYLSK